jgi:hypothetical protein
VLSLALYLYVGLQGVGWDETSDEFWEEQTDLTRWRYVGLPRLDAWRHVESDNLLAAALSGLMRVQEVQKALLKARAMDRIARAAVTADRKWCLADVVEAYLPLHEPHLSAYDHLLLTEEFKMARQLAQTTFERGEESGQRRLVREQLEERFGPLSETARTRLAAWAGDRLGELGRSLVRANSLVELGLEDPPTTTP